MIIFECTSNEIILVSAKVAIKIWLEAMLSALEPQRWSFKMTFNIDRGYKNTRRPYTCYVNCLETVVRWHEPCSTADSIKQDLRLAK